MRRLKTACISGMMACALLAACDDGQDGGGETAVPKEATLLVYMVGGSDLTGFFSDNIKKIKEGYGNTDGNANVLVYTDFGAEPELYLIAEDEAGEVAQTTVKTYPDQYSVDPEVMRGVINDVFTQYPAERKGIVLASHANGSWYESDVVKKRAFGSENGYSMNITDIRKVLEDGPYMDLVMFDACMMANLETAYELKDCGHFFLTAPNSVPGEGFPYGRILPELLRMDAASLTGVAQEYMEYFRTNGVDWDDFAAISLTDLSRLDALALYVDSLFQDGTVQNRVQEVDRNDLQMFERGFYFYDAGEWLDSIGQSNPYAAKARGALEEAVVYKEHNAYSSCTDYGTPIIPIKEGAFSGLSTYVPPSRSQSAQGSEADMMRFFTALRWYSDAGLWRVPLYNGFEQAGTE